MTRRRSLAVRTVAALVGLVLVAAGGSVLAWAADLGPARDLATSFDVPRASGWPGSGWWPWALAGAAALAAVAAAGLLALAFGSRRVGTLPLAGDDHGLCTLDPHALAAAAAERLGEAPRLHRVHARVRRQRDVPTIDLVTHCAADASLPALAAAAAAARDDLAAALPGIDVRQRVLVHVDRVDRHDHGERPGAPDAAAS